MRAIDSGAVAVGVLMLMLCGCATSSATPKPDASGNSQATPATGTRWTGSIRPRNQETGEAMFRFDTPKYGGNVYVMPAEGDLHQTTVEIMLRSNGSKGPSADLKNVSWGVVDGRCGVSVAPVLPVTSFAPVELNSTGNGGVKTTIPWAFPTKGEYHVDFYAGRRSGRPEVVACADLKLKTD